MAASAKIEITPLMDLLRERIAREGPLAVADYMQLCLSHPQHGYYMTRDPLGGKGDFVTAPEVSQMFGEIIGAYVAERWRQLGAPSPFHLVECGPGRGTLMKDMMRVIARVPELAAAAKIHLVETSPALKKIQKETLKDFSVAWHDDFDGVPEGAFALIANEFLDALPIQQYQYHEGQWRERRVGLRDGALVYMTGGKVMPQVEAEEGDVFEFAPAREAFVRQVCARLKKHKGFALLVDYGAERSGFGDTLQAVRGHKFSPVFENPGESDLTSHVDFGALKETALAEGVKSETLTQGAFLERYGIVERAGRLKRENPQADIGADLARLTAKEQMGELFKVMILPS